MLLEIVPDVWRFQTSIFSILKYSYILSSYTVISFEFDISGLDRTVLLFVVFLCCWSLTCLMLCFSILHLVSCLQNAVIRDSRSYLFSLQCLNRSLGVLVFKCSQALFHNRYITVIVRKWGSTHS